MEIGQKLNGKFEVIAIQEIVAYGKYFTNKTIKSRFYARGIRGAVFLGYLFVNGQFRIERNSESTQLFEGHVKYDGEHGCQVEDKQEIVSALKNWTLKRHGIGAMVVVKNDTILFSVKTIYSAFTLLREFGLHKASVMATSRMEYLVNVPLQMQKNYCYKI